MIPSWAILLVAAAWAQEADTEGEGEGDDDLSSYRTRFDVLADRAIGTTSVPVEFNWRRSPLHLAATGSYLVELNNFNSMRAGALARVPTGKVLLEFGATYAATWDSPSSRLLAFVPYRQPGRPNRLELDAAVGFPLAEGVATTAPRWFPAVQLVLDGYAGFRYIVYPTGFADMRVGEVIEATLSPRLTDTEIDNLDDARLDAMQVDLGRYNLYVGLGTDVYFKPGLFVSPRVNVAVPILAAATETDLLVWADWSLAVGFAL